MIFVIVVILIEKDRFKMYVIIGGCVVVVLFFIFVIIVIVWYCKKIKKNRYVNIYFVWCDFMVVEGNLEEVKLIG